jgi:cell wall-associated NlpC family hydrolase
LSGLALAEIAGGVILAWSGIENQAVTATVSSLIKGKAPAPGPAGPQSLTAGLTVPTTGADLPGSGAALAGESAIATDALRYQGDGYVWGGAPAKGAGNWDCSSFANWVCGHDVGLPIPGYPAGAYTGEEHGPPTTVWLVWGGLETVSHNGDDAEPGDLCVWQTHMGIAIGGGQMISAQDPELGTGTSGINGAIPGELLFVRRYVASVGSVAPSG